MVRRETGEVGSSQSLQGLTDQVKDSGLVQWLANFFYKSQDGLCDNYSALLLWREGSHGQYIAECDCAPVNFI